MKKQDIVLDYEIVKKQIEEAINCKEELREDDHLIEMGLDSLQLMRLINSWRKSGYKVSFTELIKSPNLKKWWEILEKKKKVSKKAKESAEKKLEIKNTKKEIKEGFPLTDVQYAYWIGRGDNQVLGGVGCHAYIELEGKNIDTDKLSRAWEDLCNIHSMLRVKFLKEGRQKILETSQNKPLEVQDLRNADEEEILLQLQRNRDRLSHRKLDVANGEVAGLEISLLPNGKHIIYFDVDLLVADVQSISVIMRDLTALYNGDTLSEEIKNWRFEDYLNKKKKLDRVTKKRDEEYWLSNIEKFPAAPELPLNKKPEQIENVVFKRRIRKIDIENWKVIQTRALKNRVTPAMLLLTLYGEVLEKWSEKDRFLINIPLFNRNTEDFLIENVVSDFTNLLLLPMDFKEKYSLRERIEQVQEKFHECVAYSSFSGVEIQRVLAKNKEDLKQVAPVVFACNLGNPLIDEEASKVLGDKSYMISQTPQVWLDFQIYEQENYLELAWDSVEGLFPENMIDEMLDFYEQTLNDLAQSEETWEKPVELEKPSFDFEKYDEDKTLHELVFESAKKHSNKVALEETKSGKKVTYKELIKNVSKLVGLMKARNVSYGDRVAISVERGINQIYSVLATLAIGATYVPIGLSQPRSRRDIMQKKADVKYILTQRNMYENFKEEYDQEIISIEDANEFEEIKTFDKVNNNDLAYIIYTSGSTGEPKGVEITHRNALNTIDEINRLCEVSEKDSLLAVSNLDFDLSVYDVFGILGAGGKLYLLNEEHSKDAQYWSEMIDKNNITLWNSVPTLLEMLLLARSNLNTKNYSIKVAMLSGDWINISLPKKLKSMYSNSKILAMGGATEASIWSNYQWVDEVPKSWKTIPYGRPLRGQLYRIVDEKGRDVPSYRAGELWIGGEGIAKGYCGNKEITEKSFVKDGDINWYKTGDYGRFWSNKTIEFLGRKDTQVKIRGHRIELSEIQLALNKFEEVEEAVVLTQNLDFKNKQLITAVKLKEEYKLNIEEVKQKLLNKLPSYMQPSKWIVLDEMPITSNGKVDKNQIIRIIENQEKTKEKAVKEDEEITETERKLLRVCRGVFKNTNVNIDDHFFEIGGDSLLGTKLCIEISKEFNLKLNIGELFKKPVLKDLANHIKSQENKSKTSSLNEELKYFAIENENRYKSYPLTGVQKAYCIGRDNAYGLGGVSSQFYFEMDAEDLNLNNLNRAWQRLIDHHDALRTVFNKTDLTQRVLKKSMLYKIKIHDFSNLKEKDKKIKAEELRQTLSKQVMDINSWPLFDIQCSRLSNKDYRIHVSFDNMILDGWSIFYLMRNWVKLYRNPEMSLKKVKASFRDYVMTLERLKETEMYKKDQDYWIKRIDSIPQAPQLPLKTNPENMQNPNFKRIKSKLSAYKWNKLKLRAAEHELTPTAFLISAFSEILAKWGGSDRFTLNLTSFNRRDFHDSIQELVGDFTSLLLLEVDRKNKNTFSDKAKQIQKQLSEDMSHTLFDGVDFQRQLAKKLKKSRTNIMPIVFTSTLGVKEDSSEEWMGEVNYSITQTPQIWLDHQVQEINGELLFNWDVVDGLFPDNMIEEMFDAYDKLLNQLIEIKNVWKEEKTELVEEIELSERRKANQTKKEIKTCTLHELFYRRAELEPEKEAIKTDDKSISYKELRFYAKELQEELKKVGVKKQDNVAILMQKGAEEIISALGILSLGAVYVPIDANTPKDRWLKVLKEADVRYVLTQSGINNLDEEFECLEVDKWIEKLKFSKVEDEHFDYDEMLKNSKEEDLAYIIYTSGTTGVPKGVMMTHKAAMNTILDINQRFEINSNDRVFALSNMNFDLSVYDVFGMLSCGGTIVIPDNLKRKEPNYWMKILKKEKITVWNTVPAFMQMLVDHMSIASSKEFEFDLKTVLLSGDWIPVSLPNKIKQNFIKSEVVSLGGATEAAIWSNYYICHKESEKLSSIPYGVPLSNQRFYILNENLREVPTWVAGKLFIAGDGLSIGYYGDEEKTNEKFVYHKELKQRLYDTGDYGRYIEGGIIEFLGRRDNQIKIRGHRVELGEVEAALSSVNILSDSYAFYFKETQSICAAIKLKENTDVKNVKEKVEKEIKKILPSYELPSMYHILKEIPLNSNGKVDRGKIEELILSEKVNQEVKETVEPRDELEKIVYNTWSEVLNKKDISIKDDFFELGGDSLKAVRICGHLEAMEFKVSIQDLFETSTIETLAKKIGEKEREKSCTIDDNNYYSEGTI